MKFETPEITISYFSTEDLITSSFDEYSTTTTTLIGPLCPAELPMD